MDERTLARFKRKLRVQPNECWHLDGYIRKDGYSDITVKGVHQLGHRVSYEHFVGPIPEGLEIDHLCHSDDTTCGGGFECMHRRCVNPEHLEPVTHRVNSLRGRGEWAKNSAKTHCLRSHEFTAENTYVDPNGNRECRTCRKESSREWVAAHNPGVRHGTETHCPQGHPYSGDNLIITCRNGRACRTCKRDWNRKYMQAKRARIKASEGE
ncbi:HNH endonuclease signature motif containing protein [Streptomyces sp. ME18-1-4]|uniref:HNH endonuclease signature motif containing protein n=1 Tax=Streptomyces sp. ME18-1-4 TaxID=3028685 RepID=UPI0029A704F8|nr:HNH endonuclease signature motif containing protein [Streptomyces sp. ME18-1-4]MDX3245832.1 HNH endonuclease signature motif containing protein [Streptomyces sp. ME18-1-4]